MAPSAPGRVRTPSPACSCAAKRVVQILNSTSVPYVTVNVLEDELLRSGERSGAGIVVAAGFTLVPPAPALGAAVTPEPSGCQAMPC